MTRGEIDHLFVLWRDVEGRCHVVGHLARRGGRFLFWYEDGAPSDGTLPMFPERRGPEQPYESDFLFPVFAQRVPSTGRKDMDEPLRRMGVEHPDDPFEVLALTGGKRATDRIELARTRPGDESNPGLLPAPEWQRIVDVVKAGRPVTVDVFHAAASSDPRVASENARQASDWNRRKLFAVEIPDELHGIVDREQAKQLLVLGARFLAHESRRP